MDVIDINDKKIILCACTSYSSHTKNGILFIDYNTDENGNSKTIFYDTKDFQVFCFCPIKEPESSAKNEINEQSDHLKVTEYFFVGGFDKKRREGRIKLYKLDIENARTKNVNGIIFLQDIEIDKTKIDISTKSKNEKNKNVNKGFQGFKGAISSMIQSTMTKEILVSCYDGKIFQLSKPNLNQYTKGYY